MPTRRATASWEGGLRGGKGRFDGESGVIGGDYSYGSRFEKAAGSSPEELLAAAEAACYNMALGEALEQAGAAPEQLETRAACTIEKVADEFRITRMRLAVRARVPGFDRDQFKDLAEATKSACPLSMALLGNVELEVEAVLEE